MKTDKSDSEKKRSRSAHYYTIYDSESDEILAFGTAQQCAKIMHITLGSFYSLISRFKNGRRNKYDVLIEDISEDGSIEPEILEGELGTQIDFEK